MPRICRLEAIVHLVDADHAVRASTQLLLQTAGIEVYAYPTAGEFLIDVRLQEIKLLVIDVNLPGMTGIELLEQLRRENITAAAIFTTARGDSTGLRAAAVRTGAAVLLKPFKPDHLLAYVKTMFGGPAAS